MAQQKTQGTITIIDTTDMARVVNWYLASASASGVTTSTSGWTTDPTNTNAIMTATKQYLWLYQQIQGLGPNNTYITINTTSPVIIGRYGQNGVSVTGVKEIYYLTTGAAPVAPSAGTSTTSTSTSTGVWTTVVPTYVPNGTYYTSIQTTLSSGTSPISSTAVVNQALTDMNYNAYMALSIAQNSEENAEGAMAQASTNIRSITRIWYAKANSTAPSAPTAHVTTSSVTTYNAWNIKRPNSNDSYPYYFYCDETCTGGGIYSWSEVTLDTSNLSQYQIGALTAKVKNFWWDSSGAHVASGKNGNSVTEGTISTYGYHALMGLTGISLNYDSAKVVDLNSTTPSLDFYQPPTISGSTVTQGKKTMMLSANALRFYNPTDGTTEQAVLDTNGLVLKKGGVKAGTAGQSGFIYLSTENYGSNLTINSHQASNWREIIGTKFGVDADGNLYASNATISGTITVGNGSDLSAGLGDYSTTAQTQSYVTGLGYQTASNVNTIIGQTNVSALNDGSDYTKTANLGNTTAVQNAAKTASNYLGDTDSQAGVTLKAVNGTTTANTNTSNYIKINTNGLEVFKAGVSIASYGDTARIGKTNNSRFLMNATSLQAYNSSNKLYFEVSSSGIKYGTDLSSSSTTTTVASTAYADDASYSVEIAVSGTINYTATSGTLATLVATPYFQGSTTLPSGVTLTYTWYKDTIDSNNIVGSNSATLSVTTAMGLDHVYICVISK